ncbi:type II toxin-antitoxin system VapC family toxin [Aerophototrophica crusticola]|uniref:Type II toxin-antitoxin system VapC family toxin n=1 Tax=Aerophototrophica crusticola TaxID=1709002 RepID=A0A858R330_9PROT|nr:type II toxin-antitoxin system VapC family toxin [Rhodospirillaceae bacterium B3]
MAGLLLDSHTALWLVTAPSRLSQAALEACTDPDASVVLSVASIWELEYKAALGKLTLPTDIWDALVDSGVSVLPVLRNHALLAAHLPLHHRDPFDRMLVAQARAEGLGLVTADRQLSAYNIPTLW